MKIDYDYVEDGARAWWTSLTPGERGVYLQALWEVEREPEPRQRKSSKPRQMTVAAYEREVRKLVRASFTGKGTPPSIDRLQELRRMDPDRFDAVREDVVVEERLKLNPFYRPS